LQEENDVGGCGATGHSSYDRLVDLVSESGHMRTDDLVSDTTVS